MIATKLDALKRVRDYLDERDVVCSDSTKACPKMENVWDCFDCLELYEWKIGPEDLIKIRFSYYCDGLPGSPCPCRAEQLGFLAPGEAITLLDNIIDELSEELSNR
jgi:hypothetical protein